MFYFSDNIYLRTGKSLRLTRLSGSLAANMKPTQVLGVSAACAECFLLLPLSSPLLGATSQLSWLASLLLACDSFLAECVLAKWYRVHTHCWWCLLRPSCAPMITGAKRGGSTQTGSDKDSSCAADPLSRTPREAVTDQRLNTCLLVTRVWQIKSGFILFFYLFY